MVYGDVDLYTQMNTNSLHLEFLLTDLGPGCLWSVFDYEELFLTYHTCNETDSAVVVESWAVQKDLSKENEGWYK